MQLIPAQHFFIKQVFVKLDRDLMYFLAFAFMCFPDMREIGAYQYKFGVVNFFHMIPDYPPGPFRIYDQVQFHLLMVMQRKIELGFCPGKNGEAITAGEWGDLF
jgi:hypothetical protein